MRSEKFIRVAFMKTAILCFLATAWARKCHQLSFDTLVVRLSNKGSINTVTLQDCIGPDNTIENTKTIELNSKLWILRRGFIHDLPNLTYVSGINNNISRIYPGAFLNLPKLEEVDITFSNIEEVLWGVFTNTSLSRIDLGRNLITLVENEAFADMPNLKILNLRKNKISSYHKNWLINSYNLEHFILSYNQIDKIYSRAFDVFPKLNYLDLSFNKIKQIDALAFNNIQSLRRLDLSSNRLSWIQPDVFRTATVVEELRLPLNLLSFLSTDFLDNGNVKSISLHPNPWQCPCLNKVLDWMRTHNATLRSPGLDHRIKYNSNLPECSFSSKNKDKCVIGYDDAFLQAQEIFFREVNYTDSVWEKPTSERPDFDSLQIPLLPNKAVGDLSPI